MKHRLTILEDLRIPPWKQRTVPLTLVDLRVAVDQMSNIAGDVELKLESHSGMSVGYDLVAEWSDE